MHYLILRVRRSECLGPFGTWILFPPEVVVFGRSSSRGLACRNFKVFNPPWKLGRLSPRFRKASYCAAMAASTGFHFLSRRNLFLLIPIGPGDFPVLIVPPHGSVGGFWRPWVRLLVFVFFFFFGRFERPPFFLSYPPFALGQK